MGYRPTGFRATISTLLAIPPDPGPSKGDLAVLGEEWVKGGLVEPRVQGLVVGDAVWTSFERGRSLEPQSELFVVIVLLLVFVRINAPVCCFFL